MMGMGPQTKWTEIPALMDHTLVEEVNKKLKIESMPDSIKC